MLIQRFTFSLGLIAMLIAAVHPLTARAEGCANATKADMGSGLKALAPLPLFDTSNQSCKKARRERELNPIVPDTRNPLIDDAVSEVSKVVPRFHVVADGTKRLEGPENNPLRWGVYRGGTLSPEGMAALKTKLGVKTIINLENDFDTAISEKVVKGLPKNRLDIKTATEVAGKLGIGFHPFHMWADFCEPSDAMLERVIEIFKNPASYPIYIHCVLGEDRTGLITALYRHYVEGMPASLAYEEMCQHGFKPNLLLGYQCWYKRRMGLPVPRRCFLAHGCQHHSLVGY